MQPVAPKRRFRKAAQSRQCDDAGRSLKEKVIAEIIASEGAYIEHLNIVVEVCCCGVS